LFSATITRSLEKVREQLSSAPGGKELLFLDANPKDETLDLLTQEYIFVPRTVHLCYLHYLLKEHFEGHSCIVFVSTIQLCELLTTMLEIMGFPATGLNSLQKMRRRQACLAKFKAGKSTILVATDVASRGLDLPKVSVVINLGLPMESDDYVHRAGRTARAGRPGLVVSVLTEQDVTKVHNIEQRIGKKLELRPTVEDAAIKLLPRTTKAQQRAELLLAEVGFEEQLAEHRRLGRERRQNAAGSRGLRLAGELTKTKRKKRTRPSK